MPPGTTGVAACADRYDLGRRIGRGGMGDIYAAHDRRLDRDVAVKVLRADLADDPEMGRRFEREARAAARVSHPNIVAIFDTGVESGRPYLVMERLPGRTLADALVGGRLGEARTRRVALDVLAALAAAHHAGITHRDVKPANVLFTAEGDAKVADFGIAKIAEALDQQTTALLLGTPSYMAPERLRGAPATPSSDLYSLGVVLYEALSGQKAFTGPNPVAVAHRIERGAPVRLARLCPGVSPQLVAVVDRAMSRDPAQRYSSADDMADALVGSSRADDATIQVGLTATIPLSRAPASASRPPSGWRRPAATVALTLAAIAALSLGAWAATRDTGPSGSREPADAPVATTTPPTAATTTTIPTTTAPIDDESAPSPRDEKGGRGPGQGGDRGQVPPGHRDDDD